MNSIAAPEPDRGALAWYSTRGATYTLLGVIALVGLLVRLRAVAHWVATHPVVSARLTGDEIGYDRLATALLAGRGINWPGRTPLYPMWLALMRMTGDESYVVTLYAQAIVGSAAIPLVFVLARRYFSTTVALVAAGLVAIDFPLIHQSVLLQTEAIYTPLVLLTVIALDSALRRAEEGRSAGAGFGAAGVMMGVSNLVRPTFILLPFVAGIAAIVRLRTRAGSRAALILILAAAIVIAPWTLRNWRTYHVFLPLATSNGILWQGSPEYYHLTRDSSYTYADIWTKVLYNQNDDAPDPALIEGERYWRDRALRSIRAEPGLYLLYCAQKAVTFWIGDPNDDWGNTFALNYRYPRSWGASWVTTARIMWSRLLIVPALLAIIVLRRRWRELIAIHAVLLYVTLLHAMTHGAARLSDPFLPLLYVLAVGAFPPAIRYVRSLAR